MVHNRTMVRVQVYLSEDELARLDRAGTTSGASRSESIRRAVRHTYGERSLDDRLRALDDSAGAWADRPMAVLSTWTRYAGSRPTTRGARPRLRVVDTSIAVDHLRGHPSAVALLHDQFLAGEPLAASEVVRFELLSGVRDGELSATERLFLAFDWLPVTESVARLAGDLATWRERIGAPTKR